MDRREKDARAAEGRLEAARLEHEHVHHLASQARKRREQNGFADMIRLAMGVDDAHRRP